MLSQSINNKIVTTSKRGSRAIWEEGGGMTSTGSAIIVTGVNGEKLIPIYIRRRGNLSNNSHALFILKEGMYVIDCNRRHDIFEINIFHYNSSEELELISEAPSFLDDAIIAAKEKANHYHCRVPHYFLPLPPKEESQCTELEQAGFKNTCNSISGELQ